MRLLLEPDLRSHLHQRHARQFLTLVPQPIRHRVLVSDVALPAEGGKLLLQLFLDVGVGFVHVLGNVYTLRKGVSMQR